MTCVSNRTRAHLRVAVIGLLATVGACTDGPNLPPEAESAPLVPGGPAQYVYPIEGVTGTACRTNYIDDGAGGCIYAPTVDDGWGTSGGGTSTGGTTTGTGAGGSGTTDIGGTSQAAFSQGPIAWAACVLAFAGSTLSVLDVADKFQTWHAAWQDARGAYDLWQVTIQNNASPEMQQLYEYQYKQALQRQEDARGDVSNSTKVSYIALGSFAVACGALALAPTP